MKTKQKSRFAEMAKDYTRLCQAFLPRPIHDEVGLQNTIEIADAFAGFEEKMTQDQNDYFDLLCTLISDYEDATIEPPKLKNRALLKHLLVEQNLSGAALSRILGKSEAVGRMILRGEREITAAHARVLSAYFNLPVSVFLDG